MVKSGNFLLYALHDLLGGGGGGNGFCKNCFKNKSQDLVLSKKHLVNFFYPLALRE